MKPLLVGEANPYGADPRYALYPEPPRSAGGRLCRQILGLSVKDYIGGFDRANLCVSTWSTKEARARAAHLLSVRGDEQHDVFILLGSKVSASFGVAYEPFTSMVLPTGPAREVAVYVLPHPSGLCRAWSEQGAYGRARSLLGPLIEAARRRVVPTSELPSAESTTERPARCSNCGRRVLSDYCGECGPS